VKKRYTIACMILGSFCVYCGQSAMHHGGDGPVSDASASTDANPPTPPVFTKIIEGDLAEGASSPTLSVGAYRQVVVYLTTSGQCVNETDAKFRPDANTQFGYTGQSISDYGPGGGLLRVDGPDMILVASCAIHYAVAGVQ